MKRLVLWLFSRVLDLAGVFLTPPAALLAKVQTRFQPLRLPLSFRVWDRFGVLPMRYHYYEPVLGMSEVPDRVWTSKDPLYGVDFNVEGQLALLRQFDYGAELARIPIRRPDRRLGFFYDNESFKAGDAECWYNILRHFKPRRVVEIGSGYSTRMAKQALDENRKEGHPATHVCIEPYNMPWLESMNLDAVIRSKVEDTPLERFTELEAGDVLFIDSSHVLRTGGDVFFEFLHVLPNLKEGVVVHIHDIFLPYEYPQHWIERRRYFPTEQYLLQAFLAFNPDFEVLLGVNYLARDHTPDFNRACPVFAKQRGRTPGSFYIRRTG